MSYRHVVKNHIFLCCWLWKGQETSWSQVRHPPSTSDVLTPPPFSNHYNGPVSSISTNIFPKEQTRDSGRRDTLWTWTLYTESEAVTAQFLHEAQALPLHWLQLWGSQLVLPSLAILPKQKSLVVVQTCGLQTWLLSLPPLFYSLSTQWREKCLLQAESIAASSLLTTLHYHSPLTDTKKNPHRSFTGQTGSSTG